MTPLISFIIPVYNVESYLTECIESLLAQEISKEIIFINDGSTDNSLSILLEYTNKYPFITLIHSHNNGVSIAKNKGINLAKGKYILFIDSDDYLIAEQTQLADIIALLSEYQPDLIRLQARIYNTFHQSESFTLPILLDNLAQSEIIFSSSYEFLHKIGQQQKWLPSVCWTLIKREYLLQQQILFAEKISAEDQLFMLQLLTASENTIIAECPTIIYNYRIRPHSITTSLLDEQFFIDHFKMAELMVNWLKQKGILDKFQQEIKFITSQLYKTAYRNFSYFTDELKHKYIHYFTEEVRELLLL